MQKSNFIYEIFFRFSWSCSDLNEPADLDRKMEIERDAITREDNSNT